MKHALQFCHWPDPLHLYNNSAIIVQHCATQALLENHHDNKFSFHPPYFYVQVGLDVGHSPWSHAYIWVVHDKVCS